jgi:hypothetical protein
VLKTFFSATQENKGKNGGGKDMIEITLFENIDQTLL